MQVKRRKPPKIEAALATAWTRRPPQRQLSQLNNAAVKGGVVLSGPQLAGVGGGGNQLASRSLTGWPLPTLGSFV